jgi:phosphopantothenoylcysteine decarboxylase/phosphopantothenate--cysteine ligase
MHPSQSIRGRRSELLAGRRIVVGISGSIAAVETPRVVRELIRHGADVHVVMSEEATRLVTAESLRFASGHPPVTALTGDVEHVTLLGSGPHRADLYLVAPATANTISKIAHGIDDTPVTSCASVALGGGVPMLLAPAMHVDMGRNPAVAENLERLRTWGVGMVAPRAEENEEKLPGPEEIAAAVLHRLARGPWVGRSVIVIGGASREPIDAVRSLTNESSGRFAVALATQAHFRGADVGLWLGDVHVPVPEYLEPVRWQSVGDLKALVGRQAAVLGNAAAVWVPAALSDFTVPPVPGKIDSRGHDRLELQLERAPKILPLIRRRVRPPGRLIAFRLESGLDPVELESRAKELLEESQADWVVANDRATMGSRETEVLLVHVGRSARRMSGSKVDVAGQLLDEVGRELPVRAPVRPIRATARGARKRRRSR